MYYSCREDRLIIDLKSGKAKMTLQKSGCHTGDPFGPPGTGLSPVATTQECFVTKPFTAYLKFEGGKIKRFDVDDFIEEVGPHGETACRSCTGDVVSSVVCLCESW